jgi:ABC-type transport system involved in multi-copper enzyme maturation permease subunit
MRINPVYQRELKTGVRNIRTAFILLGYNGLLALFGLFAFYVTFEYENRFGGTVNYSNILDIYAIITATEFGLVLFTVPALTSSSISSEREKQTLDILLTTKLSPIQIILGKLASSISMIILLAISSLPVLALVFTVGGVTIKDFFEFILLVIVTAIYIGSIGIFFSTFFKKTTAATVTTYGALLFLGIGTLIIVWGINILMQMNMRQISNVSGLHKRADIGNWILILLVNPIITCFSMIEGQIGTGKRLTTFFNEFGSISMEIQNMWFWVSVSIQLGISALLLFVSSRILDPLREKKKKYKEKNKDKENTK